MRILYISHLFPPESLGGTELYVYGLAKSLGSRHEVAVVYRTKDRKASNYSVIKDNYHGICVYKIVNNEDDYTDPYQQYYNQGVENGVIDVLKEFRPDVVHFNHLFGLSASLLSITRQRKIPSVFTLNDYWFLCNNARLLTGEQKLCTGPESGFKCVTCGSPMGGVRDHLRGLGLKEFVNWGRRYVKRRIFSGGVFKDRSSNHYVRDSYLRDQLKKVDLLVAPSQFLRSRYIEWGIPEEQIVYSDYGIDITPFGRLKRSDSPSIRFGFVGTVVYYKGVQVLIEAFNGLEEGHALLSVYGGGNNLKALKKAAKTPNIKFLGRFEPEDVGKIFSEIDILVVPSIWYENSPLVIHEAFASKVPVIASNAGGMAELVHHEVTGLLFETGSVDACYQAMKRMIDEPFLIEKFRENIPKIKTLQENATEIEKIYSKLVGGSLCDVL